MRVAFISPLFESVPPRLYGGTERVIYNLCNGLVRAGAEVTLFASGDSEMPGVELIPMIDEALRLRKKPVADPSAFNFKMLSAVARRARHFDVIHNHHDYWMLPLHWMTQTPMLTTLHGKLSAPEVGAALTGFPSASFISISDDQRKPLPYLRWLRTIHHGLDTERFEFHEKPGEYLAFLGRICADKRPEWAIEMAKSSGVPLKIAAKIEGKESQDYYDEFVKPHVDGKFIQYVGEIAEHEKSEFLGNALALAFPIDWPEPFGLVVIESLACGTPVLARPLGAVPEIMKEGVTGYTDLNVKNLADRVQRIGELDRRACRAWIEERFSCKRMTEDYIHVYERLIEQSRSGSRFRNRGRWHLLHPVQRAAHGNN